MPKIQSGFENLVALITKGIPTVIRKTLICAKAV